MHARSCARRAYVHVRARERVKGEGMSESVRVCAHAHVRTSIADGEAKGIGVKCIALVAELQEASCQAHLSFPFCSDQLCFALEPGIITVFC